MGDLESSGEFDIEAAFNELTAEESGASDDATENESLEGQPETDLNKTEEDKTLSPEEMLAQAGKEEVPANSQALLDQVNTLGLIHNGAPIKIETPEQLKEIVQKGFDYTKKTMAHAEEVRQKTEEFTQKETLLAQQEQQIHNHVFMNNIVNSWVDKIEKDDPELHDYIMKAIEGEIKEHQKNQPIIAKYEQKFKDLENRFESLNMDKQKEELGSIKQSWETELSDVQTKHAAGFSKLGVKVDWDKVKSAWSADATGKMTVEQALYASHGSEITKAFQSNQKRLETKAKTQSQILGRTGAGVSSKQAPTIKVEGKVNYDRLMEEAYAQIS